MSSYVYTKEPVALDKLTVEIEASEIIIALDKLNTNVLGDQLTIAFKSSISNAEKTILDTIVSNHDGIPTIAEVVVNANIINEPRIEYTSKYFLKAEAISGTISTGNTATIDFKIVNRGAESAIIPAETYSYKYLRGGSVFGVNIEGGDYAKFQIVDIDGTLVQLGILDQNTFDYLKQVGNGAVVVKEYVVKQFICPCTPTLNILKSETPGQVPVGLYLRCVYTAVNSGSDRQIYINYLIENKD